MDLFLNLLSLLGSLGLFLFGMKTMSEGLEKFAGDRLRSILAAMTKNRFMGVLTGIVVTAFYPVVLGYDGNGRLVCQCRPYEPRASHRRTAHQLQQLDAMEHLVGDALSLMTDTLQQPEGEGHDISRSYAIEEQINALRTQVRNDNLQSISTGEYDYKLGAFYIDYVNGLEKLADYVLNVVQSKARQTRV